MCTKLRSYTVTTDGMRESTGVTKASAWTRSGRARHSAAGWMICSQAIRRAGLSVLHGVARTASRGSVTWPWRPVNTVYENAGSAPGRA